MSLPALRQRLIHGLKQFPNPSTLSFKQNMAFFRGAAAGSLLSVTAMTAYQYGRRTAIAVPAGSTVNFGVMFNERLFAPDTRIGGEGTTSSSSDDEPTLTATTFDQVFYEIIDIPYRTLRGTKNGQAKVHHLVDPSIDAGKPNILGVKLDVEDAELGNTPKLVRTLGELASDRESGGELAKGKAALCIIESPNELTTWIFRTLDSEAKSRERRP